MDAINIKILDDGTIRVETDKISGPNHLGAEQFLREMSKLAGGTVEIKKKTPKLFNQQAQQKHVSQ